MSAVAQLVPALPVRRALGVFGASHATWYRRQRPRAEVSTGIQISPVMGIENSPPGS